MRVLIVFAGNRSQMPFIEEQIKSIRANGIDVGCFEILGKGSIGYLKNLSASYDLHFLSLNRNAFFDAIK